MLNAKVALLLLALTAAVAAGGCGGSDEPTPQSATATTPAAAATASSSADAKARLRDTVHGYATRMMADIQAAEDRGDVVDGVPVGTSSNPYDYVGLSPYYVKLVGLGEPALPALASEILASDKDGLREYLLAAAGAQIGGEVPGSGAQSWSSGKQWARQFRAGQ